MHFVSQQFLGFFAITFAGYWMLPWHRARMVWLLVASAVFYMSWNPLLIALILFSASVDYLAAIALTKTENHRLRKALLVGSISVNLCLLGFFKYAGFLVHNAWSFCNLVGLDFDQPVFKIALPLGISFYTFETISYVVDVYRRRIQPERNLLDYALFILFFPHLIAGPIVRPGDFLPQTRLAKRWSWNRLQLGVRLFLLGLFKKAVLADNLGAVADPVFANPAGYGTFETWLAVLAYTFQIYGDFSGYSDMAIGIAHLFGFKLHANFDMPYLSANIAEFWRRWHISLSSWLRDYLYIPLGGSRHGALATYRNLILTMLLGGLWHGASWTFVAWGLYHGVLLALHRLVVGDRKLLPRPVGIPLTFLAVAIGWVFFRAQTFPDAALVLTHLVQPIAGAALRPELVGMAIACLVLMLIGHLLGRLGWDATWDRRLPEPLVGATLALALLLILLFIPEDGKAFIYFQF